MSLHTTLIQKKYRSMLLSGMMGVILVSIALMTGTLVAGVFLDAEAVQAVTLVSPLYSVCAFFSYLVSYGFPVLYSVAMGRMDRQEADRIFGTGLLLSVIIGVFNYMLVALAGSRYILSYSPSPEVYSLAMKYLVWIRIAVLGLPLVCIMNGAVYADGDAMLYNIASIAQLSGTVVLSIVFCKIYGIAGISMGFALPLWSASLICFGHLFRKGNSLRLNLCFSREVLVQMAKYSLPDAGKYLFSAVFTSVMNYYVSSAFGAGYVLLVSAVVLTRDLQVILDSPGQGASPILGVYLGEGSYSGIRSVYRMAERSAVFFGLLLSAVLFLTAPFIPHLLSVDDPVIAGKITVGLRILSLSLVFTGLLYWITSYYIVLGRVYLSVIVTGLYDAAAPVLCGIAGGRLFGVYGWFAGMMLSRVLVWAGVSLVLCFRYGRDDYRYLIRNREANCSSALFSLSITPQEIIRVRDEAGAFLLAQKCSSSAVNRSMLLIEEFFMLIYERNTGTVSRGDSSVNAASSTPEQEAAQDGHGSINAALRMPEQEATQNGHGSVNAALRMPEQKAAIQGECVVNVTDRIDIIIRDEGIMLDLTDPDLSLDSLRAYIVPLVVNSMTARRQHLSAIGFNRNRLAITDPFSG